MRLPPDLTQTHFPGDLRSPIRYHQSTPEKELHRKSAAASKVLRIVQEKNTKTPLSNNAWSERGKSEEKRTQRLEDGDDVQWMKTSDEEEQGGGRNEKSSGRKYGRTTKTPQQISSKRPHVRTIEFCGDPVKSEAGNELHCRRWRCEEEHAFGSRIFPPRVFNWVELVSVGIATTLCACGLIVGSSRLRLQ